MLARVTVEAKLDLRDELLSVLQVAATERRCRMALVPAPDRAGRFEPEWVAFERSKMVAAVNAERALRGLAAADPGRLRSAESAAVGHIDYMEKFALYCAEIALGDVET